MSERAPQLGGSRLEPGSFLGRYEIERRLASGGMAEIYIAWQPGLGGMRRRVVLKRVHPHLAGEEDFIRMFLREAEIAASLSHPNIVRLYETIQPAQGEHIIVMEYVHGHTVSTICRTLIKQRALMPLGVALRIAMSTCGALDYAYNSLGPDLEPRRVIHRDVTPSNILVSMDGLVRLVDFGIAKALGQQSFTQSGTLRGKLSYMSPEQVEAKKLDQRADLFAVGVVLFEMTTSKRLFRRDNDPATLRAVLDEPITRPSSVVSNYPPALEAIVMKLLSRDKQQRFSRGKDVVVALQALIDQGVCQSVQTDGLGAYMRTLFPRFTDDELATSGEWSVDSLVPGTEPRGAQLALRAPLPSAAGTLQQPAMREPSSTHTTSRDEPATWLIVTAVLIALSVVIWLVIVAFL